MCGGCRVNIGGEMKYACVDGPDFDGFLVDFDEVITRAELLRGHRKNTYAGWRVSREFPNINTPYHILYHFQYTTYWEYIKARNSEIGRKG